MSQYTSSTTIIKKKKKKRKKYMPKEVEQPHST
jgi:hypothetical protein